jgi:hypothetical protein
METKALKILYNEFLYPVAVEVSVILFLTSFHRRFYMVISFDLRSCFIAGSR